MKAQFKYAFRAGLPLRGATFAAILVLNLVFVVLGAFGLLPFAALVTAVSLSGTAIAVMMAMNIVSDIIIARRMFSAPGAYLHALTPAPRRQILLSSSLAMLIMDFVTMAVAITGVVVLSLQLAGVYTEINLWEAIQANTEALYTLLMAAPLLTGYMLILMIILFCVSMRRSVFYNIPAGGLLTALLAIAIIYAVSLSLFILAPFGVVTRFGLFFTISLGSLGIVMSALLFLVQAVVLFALTAKLLERKVNI